MPEGTRSEGETYAQRPALRGTRHMVAAGHYGAAHAAFAILEAGGNAVDAAVAGGIALGVLQPDIVNVAGVAPIMLRMADGVVQTIAGLGYWPAATDPDRFTRENGGHIPESILRTVVPAAPDAWITALSRFGTMKFGDVVQAAIRFADEGFPVYPLLADMIGVRKAKYARFPSSAAIFLPGAEPPKVGTLFVQKDLARTLRYMADEEAASLARHGDRAVGLEAARAAFYRGDIAQAIVAFHKQEGGWLTAQDLADYHSPIERAPSVRFAGTDVYTCGAWCQGPVLGQALNILDASALKAAGHNSADYLHTVAEALKLAFADREAFGQIVQPKPGRNRQRQGTRVRSAGSVPEVAEDGAVEVHKAKQAGRNATREDERHRWERSGVSVRHRGLNRFARVAEDVPEEEDQDPGRERVQESLHRLRKAAQPRHRQAQENRGAGDRPK